VRRGLEGNQQSQDDLRKLAKAKRLLPDCVAKV